MTLENREKLTVFDGAIGTEVQKRSPASEDSLTDLLNLTQPEVIESIHRDYLAAGARVLTTNTFSSSAIRLSRSGHGEKTKELNERGARLAREAIEDFSEGAEKISVAGSIGPTGETLVPLGDWTFDQFYETFRNQAEALKQGGVDWIIIETMESLREATAALAACGEVGLPVISSLSYGDRGRTSYGVVPASGAITLDYI
ncbi:MAG: homocysteine S-methyltransferase family protein, partial [Candidatus Aenigmatarchaeota archaeon]